MVAGLGYIGAGLGGIQQGYNEEYQASLAQNALPTAWAALQYLGQVPPMPSMGGPPPQFSPQMAGGPMPQGSPPGGVLQPGGGIPPPPQSQPMPPQQAMGPSLTSTPGGTNFADRFPSASTFGRSPEQPAPPMSALYGQAQTPPQAVPPQQQPRPQAPPQQQIPPQAQPTQGYGGDFSGGFGAGGMYGGYDLQRVIQAVDRANPGAPPQVKMAAVEMLTKNLLNPQQALQFRQMQLMQRAEGMGLNASMKLADINTKRQMQELPPITMQEALTSGMLEGGGSTPQGQGQQPQQQPGQQGDPFQGIDPAKLQRANQLGFDRNAILQAATVYQQTGQWPQGLGTRAGSAVIQGVVRDVVANLNRSQNIDTAQMTKSWTQYKGEQAYQRTAGQQSARVESAVNEVEQLIPQALETSRNFERLGGKYTSLNKLFSAYEAGTSDPKYNDFLVANFSLANAYGRAMNPTGQPRITERLEREALDILSTQISAEAYEIQVRRLWKEVQASKKATTETQAGRKPGAGINAPLPGEMAAPKTGGQDMGGGWTYHGSQ